MELATKPLDAVTWPDFARLAEDHHGVWNGCWCLNFHEEGAPGVHAPEDRRALKEARGRERGALASLVYDGAQCVGFVSPQRHRGDVRTARLRAQSTDRQTPLGGEPTRLKACHRCKRASLPQGSHARI